MLGKIRRIFRWVGGQRPTGVSARQSAPTFDRDEDSVYPKLYDANLEDRRVLNADPLLVGADALLHIDARSGANDGLADQFQIRRESTTAGDNIVVDVNNERVWTGSISSIQGIVVQGSRDQDIVNVDPAIALQSGIVIHGGGANDPSTNAATRVNDIVLIGSATDRIQGGAFDSDSQGFNIRLHNDGEVSRFQLVDIELIADLTQSTSREFQINGLSTWALSDANLNNLELLDRAELDLFGTSGQRDAMLQLGASNTQVIFGAGMDGFQISASNEPLASPIRLDIQDAHLNQIDHTDFALRSSDVIAFDGHVQLPQRLDAYAGTIDLRGSLEGVSSTVNLQADLSIRMDRSASLSSHGGPVTFSASDINIDGAIQVGGQGSIALNAGSDGMLVVTGKLFATGSDSSSGGRIDLRGGEIQILDEAQINVSGSGRAGSISIGGDFRGLPGALPNSQQVFIDSSVRIQADGIEHGEGGEISIWSENKTDIRGTHVLTARGGTLSGNGGVIETSSRGKLIIDDPVSLASAHGLGGTWIIDPRNIHVVADTSVAVNDTANSYVKVSVITNQLNAGSTVILDTSDSLNASGNGAGDILVTVSINVTAATSGKLVFEADRNFVMSNGVTISGHAGNSLGVEINAGNNIDASLGSFSNLKYLNAVAVGTVNMSSITANGAGDSNGRAIFLSGNSIVATGAINAAGGDVEFTSTGLLPTVQLSNSANITTTGGDVTFNGGATVVFNGTRSISTSGGNVTMTNVASIDSTVAASTIQISTTAAASGGDVALASIPNIAGNIRSLTIDTHGTTGNGGDLQLGDVNLSSASSTLSINLNGVNDGSITLNNQTAGVTTITFSGNLNLASYDMILADNAQLTTVGGGSLTLGKVQNSAFAPNANLSLASQDDVSLNGIVNIGSGSLIVLIDTDDSGASSFSNATLATINAGSISVTGSAARNDTATINAAMTTQGGGIVFSTLDKVTLNSNLNSGSTITFTNIKTNVTISGLTTAGARQISAAGTIDFTGAPTISQTGANNTFVTITTTGSGGSINFSSIASVNSPTMTIDSKAGVSATGAIDLNNGTLDIKFGQSGAGSNTATFQDIDAGKITIQGINATDQLTLNNAVTTSTSDLTLRNATVTLKSDLTATGGDIVIDNVTLLISGSRTLRSAPDTGGTSGNVTMSGSTTVDGTGATPGSLTINTNGTQAGNVVLAPVVALNAGLNSLTITTEGSTASKDGTVTISNVRLVRNGNVAGQLNINATATTQPDLFVNGVIDLSESFAGAKGGSVNFGTSIIQPLAANSNLTILTRHTGSNDGGNIQFGAIANSGTLFDSIVLDAGVADTTKVAGTISFANGTNHILTVDGTAATQATIGIRVEGTVTAASSPNKSLTFQSLALAGTNSLAIDISKATLQGYRGITIDSSGSATGFTAQNAGHVYLGGLSLTLATSSVTVDTRGTTSSGTTFVDDKNSTNTTLSINVNGPADFSNTNLSLAKSTSITTTGNNDTLSIKSIQASTVNTVSSLLLSSEHLIVVSTSINLPDADITLSIDTDNSATIVNPIAGSITGKSILVEGSTTVNDSATFSGAITSTVGSITFSRLANLTLNGDVTSAAALNLNNVTTSLSVGPNVDLTAISSIDLSSAPALTLTGGPNTTVSISATGTGSSVVLKSVAATDSPNLSINARGDVTLTGKVDINNGTFTVNFGQDNTGTAEAEFSDTIDAGVVSVTGGTQTGDNATFNKDVLATTGDVTTASTAVTLKANIQTSGGKIQMSGGKLFVDGTATRTLRTGGATSNVANAGNVDLSGMTEIDGVTSAATFVINASGTTTGGSVSLSNVVAKLQGIHQLTITTAPTTGTVVQLGDVRLVSKAGVSAALRINSGDTNAATILANGTIDLSVSTPGQAGGQVDLGSSILRPLTSSSTITIRTNNTSGSNTAGSNGGNITLGGIGVSNASNYFDSVVLNAGGATNSNNKGTILFQAPSVATPVSITVDGAPADQNTAGITIIGNINLAANAQPQSLTLETRPSATGPANSMAIDLSRADFIGGYGNLTIRTSSNQSSLNAGNVSLGDVVFDNTSVTSSLTIDTSGQTTQGLVTLQDVDSTASKTTLHVNGSLDTNNTILKVQENTDLKTTGASSSMNLGAIESVTTAPIFTLAIAADRGVQLNGAVTVPNANVTIQFGSNGSQNLTISQPVLAQSVSITGSGNNDDATLNGSIETGPGNISLSQLRNITLASNLTTAGGNIVVSGSSLRIDGNATRTLKTAGATTAVGGSVDLSGVTSIDGASKPGAIVINTTGTSGGGSVSLGNVEATNGGINRIDITTFVPGGTDGSVTIRSVRLVADGSTPAQFNFNVGKNAASTISAEGTIDLSETVQGRQAGTVNLGRAIVVPINPTSTLTILTNHKNATVGNDNSNAGNIILGGIGNTVGDQFDSVTLDASVADPLDDAGRIDLSLATSPSIVADGPAATQSTVNILMAGDVRLPTDGSGLTVQTLKNANRTGAINLSRAAFVGNGNLNVDTTGGGGATSTGQVFLGDIDLTSAPSQLSVSTQAATPANSGIVLVDDGDGTRSTTSIRVLGSVNLSNSVTELNDNTLIETLGEGNTLSVGTVNQTTGATNVGLVLKSEDGIVVAGPISLDINSANTIVDIQVDSNNNSSSALTISGAINAATVSLKGSAANDETADINGAVGAGAGGITISNFQSVKISQNLTSQSSITANQIATEIELVGGTVLTAGATISMSNNVPLIRLTGLPNSTVTFNAQGNGSVDLPNVSSPNGINLTIGANNSVKTGTVNIGAGDLQINFSRTANAAASADLQSISAGSVSVNGANRTTDSVMLRDTLTSTKPAGTSITNGGNITVFADLLTQGGALTISGRQLLFDGPQIHNLNTNINGVTKGGNIDLSGITSIDATPGVTSLTLNTQGTSDGGSVSMAPVVATQGGLNRLVISSAGNGGLDGQVTLKDVRLVNKLGTQSRLDVNSTDLTPSIVLAQGLIDLSESGTGVPGGVVDFGDGQLAPSGGTGRLTITVASTNNQPGIDGSNAGSVRFGGTTNNAASVYDFVSINAGVADPAEQQGTIQFGSNTNKTIAVDGTPTNQNSVGIELIGQVALPQASILTLQTLPGTNGNSQAIDLSRARFQGNGTLRLDTSSNGTSGNILLGDVLLTTGASSLIVSTQGTTAFGVVELNDSDGATTATEIQILGAIDLSQARVRLLDNTLIRTFGDNGVLQVGRVDTDTQRDLTLTSSSNLTLSGPIALQGGALSLTVDQDDNQLSTLNINGSINAGGVSIAGLSTNLDQLTISQNVTTTSGAININQFDTVVVGATLQSNTGLSIANVHNKISLGTDSQILANGAIQLNSNVNRIELSGLANSTSIIDSTGPTAAVALAPIVDVGNAVELRIGSDGGVSFSSINASQTNVTVQFSRDPNVTNQAIALDANVARGISIQGGNKTTDLVSLQGVQQLGTSGLTLSNIGNTVWNASIDSGGAINVTNVSGKVQIADGVNVDGTGGIGIASGVSVIEYLGSAGSSSRIKSVGDGGNVNLASIQATNGVNLSILSDNSIVINSIQNGSAGSVDVQVDANNNSVNSASLTSGAIESGEIRAQGSAALDDVANLNGAWISTRNDIQLSNWKDVNISNGLQSTRAITLNNISNAVSLNSTAAVVANAGNVAMQNGVNQINLTTNGDYVITALQGSVSAGALVGNGVNSNLRVNADSNIQLHSTSAIGSLQLQSGRNNSAVGSIEASNTLQASTIQMDAATGIGTSSPLSTATSSIQASNRLAGNIDISNTSANQTTLNLTNLGNGFVRFAQSGGGDLSITNVKTEAIGAPVLDRVNIAITNTGGNIQLESSGTGIQAGALGSIQLQTLSVGNININDSLTAASGRVVVQSVGQINGIGLVTANAVVLEADTGVGATQAMNTITPTLDIRTASGNIAVSNTSAATATVDLLTRANGSITFVHNGSAAIIKQASALGAGAGSIDVTSAGGNLTIQGPVINGGMSTTSGIVLSSGQNIVLASGAIVQTEAPTDATKIEIKASGQFVLQSGAEIRAGVSDSATEARLSKIPIPLAVFPVVNAAGVNVDGNGNVELEFRIGSTGSVIFDKNFLVTVDWGDGSTSVLPDNLLPFASINGDGTTFSVKHTYLLNPNSDSTAPIPIIVTAKSDSLDRILISESQTTSAQLQVSRNVNLLVPASGLFAIRFELAQAAEVIRLVSTSTTTVTQTQDVEVSTAKPLDFTPSASESVAKKERSYVIRIVTPKDDNGAVDMSEAVSITEDELNDLSTLFSKLGDNRYRIFVTYENGIEVLLRDFYLRNGIPAEIDDSVGSGDINQESNGQDNANAIPPQASHLFQPDAQHQEFQGESMSQESVRSVAESSRLNTEESDQEASEVSDVGNNLLQTVSAALGWRSLKKAARRLRSAS